MVFIFDTEINQATANGMYVENRFINLGDIIVFAGFLEKKSLSPYQF